MHVIFCSSRDGLHVADTLGGCAKFFDVKHTGYLDYLLYPDLEVLSVQSQKVVEEVSARARLPGELRHLAPAGTDYHLLSLMLWTLSPRTRPRILSKNLPYLTRENVAITNEDLRPTLVSARLRHATPVAFARTNAQTKDQLAHRAFASGRNASTTTAKLIIPRKQALIPEIVTLAK